MDTGQRELADTLRQRAGEDSLRADGLLVIREVRQARMRELGVVALAAACFVRAVRSLAVAWAGTLRVEDSLSSWRGGRDKCASEYVD